MPGSQRCIKVKENLTSTSSTVNTPTDDISQLTGNFEKLGGTWIIDRQKEFVKDQAIALMYIDSGLRTDDKPLIDLYETAKNVYSQLKMKYSKTNETTANKYIGPVPRLHF